MAYSNRSTIYSQFNQTNCDRILDEISETIPKYNKKNGNKFMNVRRHSDVMNCVPFVTCNENSLVTIQE